MFAPGGRRVAIQAKPFRKERHGAKRIATKKSQKAKILVQHFAFADRRSNAALGNDGGRIYARPASNHA